MFAHSFHGCLLFRIANFTANLLNVLAEQMAINTQEEKQKTPRVTIKQIRWSLNVCQPK